MLWLFHDLLARNLTLIKNNGVSFGMGGWFGVGLVWLQAGVVWWFWRLKDKRYRLMAMGGAVNLIDRVVFGYVRDYWKFFGGIYNNINDYVIGFGMLWIVFLSLKRKK